jgi:hypothetical protein
VEHWRFDGGADFAEWSWMCMNDDDGLATQSSQRTFSTLSECMQDAVANGYAD